VLGLDAAVFVPHNATAAVTQTWQAAHPAEATAAAKATRTAVPAPTRSSRRTATPVPGNFDQSAENINAEAINAGG
jgi:hypothetical protein